MITAVMSCIFHLVLVRLLIKGRMYKISTGLLNLVHGKGHLEVIIGTRGSHT